MARTDQGSARNGSVRSDGKGRGSNRGRNGASRAKRSSESADAESGRGTAGDSGSSAVRLDLIGLSEIRRWPRNPKNHDIDAIVRSIERFGFTLPLIVDEGTGQLVAGHGRSEALLRMKQDGRPAPKHIEVTSTGDWRVPVMRGLRFESEKEAEAYLLADNRLVEIGGWDADEFREFAQSFSFAELGELGFDNTFVSGLFGAPQESSRDVNFKAKKPQDGEMEYEYRVVVEVDSEEEQRAVIATVEKKGWKCRALIL